MSRCPDYEVLITGYIDGELEDSQKLMLENHLKDCAECRKELERARVFKDTLDMMTIRTPEDDFWDGYWAGIYNRLERKSAWYLFVAGLIILISGGVIGLFREVLFADETPMWVTGGGTISILGTVALIVSLIRERVRVNKHERYKDVRR